MKTKFLAFLAVALLSSASFAAAPKMADMTTANVTGENGHGVNCGFVDTSNAASAEGLEPLVRNVVNPVAPAGTFGN